MKCKVINAFREAHHLSIEEFAELIGCSPKIRLEVGKWYMHHRSQVSAQSGQNTWDFN